MFPFKSDAKIWLILESARGELKKSEVFSDFFNGLLMLSNLKVEYFFVIFHLVLQCHHFNGGDCGFVPLIAVFSSRTVKSLLLVFGGKHSEYNGDVVVNVNLGDSLCYTLADEIEMAGFSLNNAA